MNTDGVQHPKKKQSGGTPPKEIGRIGSLKQQMYSRLSQPMKRPRRELDQIERATQKDWKSDVPTETPHEGLITPPEAVNQEPKSYSFTTIFLVVAIIVFVIAGGIATSFFLSGSNVVTSRKIDISINGPRTIDGGEVLELQVTVRNNNNAVLELADLIVTYPVGARTASNLGVALETQRIPLGTIEPGGSRTGTIAGVLFGRAGDRQDVEIALEYRLEGSSALFVAEAKHTVLVSSGTLEISLNAKEQAVAGQSVDMTATITSKAKTIVRDVVVRPSYPFGFTQTNTSPATDKNGMWILGDFAPGESRTIRIVGVLDGQTGDTRIFRLVAGTRTTKKSTMVDVVLADFEQKVTITRPFLGMTLAYEGMSADEYVGFTGTTILVRLSWTNNLTVALSDVVIAATLSGIGLDPFNVSADSGFYRSIDSVILWDKTTTKGELEHVPAGASGRFTIRLLPKTAAALLNKENPTIKIELHAAGQRLSEGQVPETIQAVVSEEISLQTDVKLSGKALYFENPLGSVGPLPPKVEYETTYGILWEISNTTNIVNTTKVTAVLPPYVRWLGTVSPSVEYVTFNESDGTVTWNVGKLLPNTGVGTTPSRRVVFSIGLVPSTSQVGQSPALIQNQKLVGVDEFVSTSIESTVSDFTTDLDEVEFADNYGNVAL